MKNTNRVERKLYQSIDMPTGAGEVTSLQGSKY
jgi:hypothetical protein